MTINGIELNFSFYEADTMELCGREEAKVQQAQAEAMELIKQNEPYDALRKQCKAVRTFFDNVFGEGTGDSVCGTTDNVMKHLEAYKAILDEIDRQKKEFEDLTGTLSARTPMKDAQSYIQDALTH